MSVTENFGSIHVPRPDVENDDEDEAERDAQQKEEELKKLLADNAFDDLIAGDDSDSMDDDSLHHYNPTVGVHHGRVHGQAPQPNGKLDYPRVQNHQQAYRREETENVPPAKIRVTKPDPVVYMKPEDRNRAFSAQNSRLAELEVLFESRGRELQRLQQDFENQARDHAKEVRSLKHQLAMLSTDKSGVEVTLRGSQSLLEEKQKEIAKLRASVESITTDRDRFEKLHRDLNLEHAAAKSRIAALEEELTDLKRSDTYKKAVQNYEARIEGMRESHRKELAESSERLLAERQAFLKLNEEVRFVFLPFFYSLIVNA
jgi:hypothetical protein